MAFEKTSLRSQVSRRIFGLFIISALVPILTITLISFNQVSKQLEKESRKQIYRESRATGLILYDRLLSLESNLKLIANALQSSENRISLKDDKWLRSIYSAVYIVNKDSSLFSLFGETQELATLNQQQLEHIDSGNTLLQTSISPEGHSVFLLVTALNPGQSTSHLVGQVNLEYIRELGIHSPDIYCLLGQEGKIHFCSDPFAELANNDSNSKLEFSTNENFSNVKIDGQLYGANSWDVFLEAHFGHESLSVLIAKPNQTLLEALEEYKNIFPQTLIITGLLVALLSINQIRRSMVPLEKLMDGTNKIARGDFGFKIDIDSGDEFEKLGNSFNVMTERLDEQFRVMKALSIIDRLILSSLDRNYIVETLLQHLHNIVNADYVSVVMLDDCDNEKALMSINRKNDASVESDIAVNLSREELNQLENCPNYLITDKANPKSYTESLIDLGGETFLVLPVRNKEGLIALICISTSETIEHNETIIVKLHEIADRVAVALSNAAWEEQLYHQAHHDALTQLPNRSYFRARLEQEFEVANRSSSYLSILFIDLDRFKDINDSLGHVFGDEVLVQVASILGECVRKSDTVARFGGDEFIVLVSSSETLPDITGKSARLATRIINRMQESFSVEGRDVYITPSIGIAVYPRDADDFDELLKNADSAMYSAKDSGRACYRFYTSEFNNDALQILELGNDLRHAIANNELSLIYQPKISCHTGEVTGAEALVRWKHPRHGFVEPSLFVSMAEDSGLIIDIGKWVLTTACEQSKKWETTLGKHIPIAVNISAEQFRHSNLFETFRQVIQDSHVAPGAIELEITEGLTIENLDKTIKVLNKFQSIGVSIALDDFGTGYSSLSYLHRFPVNKLKIDRSFIAGIEEKEESRSIIKTIVALAHNLDFRVVAEGVETEAQYSYLCGEGCDEAQGYFFCAPQAPDEFEKNLQEKFIARS